MYSEVEGRICALKEENDNLPAYVNYNSKQPFSFPLFSKIRVLLTRQFNM